jgi:hypothetical protein
VAASKRYRGEKLGGQFLGLPHEMLNHRAFLGLSPYAKALLLDVAVQYRGDNNGDLSCAWKLMKPRGWRSEATLNKAKRELLDAGFLFEARKGRRPNVCGLYALTWREFNDSPKHDCKPTAFLRGAYRFSGPLALVASQNAALAPRGGAVAAP